MPVNGIPKNERVWVERLTEDGEIFYITSKEDRMYYFLYKMENGKAVKIGKSKSPAELENKYINNALN